MINKGPTKRVVERNTFLPTMSQRVKRPTSPDPDALEEDERMYGEESASVGVNETYVYSCILFSLSS